MALYGAIRLSGRILRGVHSPGPAAGAGALRLRGSGAGDNLHIAGLCGQRHGHRPHPEKGYRRPGFLLGVLLQPGLLPAAVYGAVSGGPGPEPAVRGPEPDAGDPGAGPEHSGLRGQKRAAGLCGKDHAVSPLFLCHFGGHRVFRRRGHIHGLSGLRHLGPGDAAAAERGGEHRHPVAHRGLEAPALLFPGAAEGPGGLWLEDTGLGPAGHGLSEAVSAGGGPEIYLHRPGLLQ